jgi:two-component system invasion response regulator UvrY
MGKNSANEINVLLVDDHAVVREGYRRLLERSGNIVVIGEADNAAQAYSLFCTLGPHIAVIDITLPGTSGIEAMRRMIAHRYGRWPQGRSI